MSLFTFMSRIVESETNLDFHRDLACGNLKKKVSRIFSGGN